MQVESLFHVVRRLNKTLRKKDPKSAASIDSILNRLVPALDTGCIIETDMSNPTTAEPLATKLAHVNTADEHKLPVGLFPTLWGAFEYAKTFLKARSAWSDEFDGFMHTGGIPYGDTQQFHFKLERLGGKFTDKFFHLYIYRHDTGYYEVVAYIL